MHYKKTIITSNIGLHARPASIFVRKASKYKSNIAVVCNGREANAKSIMSVLALAAGQGSEITITAEGPDEKEAVFDLVELIENVE